MSILADTCAGAALALVFIGLALWVLPMCPQTEE
jgi:hypothetical protein